MQEGAAAPEPPKRGCLRPVFVSRCLLWGSWVARQRHARAGCGASPRRSARCADSPAMLGLAAPSPNSLRDLRSLRSDSVDESEDEARCARGHEPWPCERPGQEARPFARHKQSPGLLVSLLTFSAPQRRAFACPGVPLLNQRRHARRDEPPVDFAAGAARGGRFLWRREAQRQGRRARARFVN